MIEHLMSSSLPGRLSGRCGWVHEASCSRSPFSSIADRTSCGVRDWRRAHRSWQYRRKLSCDGHMEPKLRWNGWFSIAFLKTSAEPLRDDETASSIESRGSNRQIEISLWPTMAPNLCSLNVRSSGDIPRKRGFRQIQRTASLLRFLRL